MPRRPPARTSSSEFVDEGGAYNGLAVRINDDALEAAVQRGDVAFTLPPGRGVTTPYPAAFVGDPPAGGE